MYCSIKASERKQRDTLKEKRKIDWLVPLVLVFSIGFLILCLFRQEKPESHSEDELQVTFFAVGKSDAILVEQGESRMLIDTGLDEEAGGILRYLAAHDINSLDYLVITHFDKDHVGGADRILDTLEVKETLEPDYVSDSEQYLEYQEALIRNQANVRKVTKTEEGKLGDASFAIYPPRGSFDGNDNNQSLVLSLRYGEKSFLFDGDSEEERLEELMTETDLNLQHTVLKVPHHGRKEKISKTFLQKVMPAVAVITCEEKDQVSGKLLKNLEELQTEVYLTSDGTVICITDGKSLHVDQKVTAKE